MGPYQKRVGVTPPPDCPSPKGRGGQSAESDAREAQNPTQRTAADTGTEQQHSTPTTATTYADACHSVAATCETPKRTGWDSNPRAAFTTAGFQDRCIRPLCHPSPPNGKNFDADFDAGNAQRPPQNVKMDPELILRLAERLSALPPDVIAILTDLLGQEPAHQQPADDQMGTRQE